MIKKTNKTLMQVHPVLDFSVIRGYYPYLLLSQCISSSAVLNSAPPFKRSMSSSGTKSRKKQVFNKDKSHKELPTSGYIGKTRFDLFYPMFQDLVLKLSSTTPDTLISQTTKVHDSLIRNHGIVEGTSKWKAITLYATGLLEGRDPKNPGWVSTGKVDKWPNKLGHLRPLFHFVKDNIFNEAEVERITEVRRFLLICFKLNQVCNANLKVDLADAKVKFKLDPELVKGFEAFARNKLSVIRESITLTDLKIDLYLSPNNGPNSVPMQESALKESAVLVRDKTLGPAFKELCTITGNNKFYEFFAYNAKRLSGAPSLLRGVNLRKITAYPDKGNKSRNIAICDLWTQSALMPIERKVVEVTDQLYSYNCCYFSHKDGWAKILDLPEGQSEHLVSLDASAWTDNLPASLQYIVMKSLFGQKLALSWKALAVDCEWFVPGFKHPFRYGKGQGMGTKGSFVIAQLTDLIFLEYSLNRLYPEVSSPFFIKVGDDLVTYDAKFLLKRQYESIGVPINITKSKFKTSYGAFVEFVSRNSWNGNDYSIISPKLALQFMKNDFYASTLYNHVIERSKGILSDFNALLALKHDYLKSKPNFDLEKFDARVLKIQYIVSLLGKAENQHLFDVELSPWHMVNKEVLLNFLNMWVNALLGEFLVHTIYGMNTEESQESLTKANAFVKEYYLTSSGISATESEIDSFFSRAVENGLTIQAAARLRQMVSIVREQRTSFSRGQENVKTLREIQVFEASGRDNEFIISPQFVAMMLRIVDQIGSTSVGYKTLRRLTIFDGANVKANIHLHRHLYNVLSLSEFPLNFETGVYFEKSSGKSYQISPDVVDAFRLHLGFDGILDQISRMRQDDSCEVSMFQLNTAKEEDHS